MSFTRTEKLAMLQLLDLIIISDEKISTIEGDFLGFIINELDIDISSINDIRKMDVNMSLDIVKRMSRENKEAFRQLAIDMAKIDGEFHPKEKAFISLISAAII